MAKLSKYQQEKVDQLKQKALTLYKQGLTTREVGKIIDRSYSWVALVIKELEDESNSTKINKDK